ncbi:MAG: orotidine-5'-phosphate decarboxylase [Patescibacteria group bacterium]
MEILPVIVALDDMDRERAISIARALSGRVWGFKVHELVDVYGPEIIGTLKIYGRVFVDMKVSDTPKTTRNRVRAYVAHGADFISVHAERGENTLRAAVKVGRDRIVAITTLTSEADASRVTELARTAYKAGIKNIVCSAHEAGVVRAVAPNATIISPGIREKGAPQHDQVRTMSAPKALLAGADLLVIGRPITDLKDPTAALEGLFNEKEDPV